MAQIDEKVFAAVRDTGNIMLATHFNPDGDAMGSLLGLAYGLESLGKKVFRYLEEPVLPAYRFLPGCGRIQTDMAKVQEFVQQAGDDFLLLCLDCGDVERLGRHGAELMRLSRVMLIDHHTGNDGFGEASWIEPNRSSTGEMVFDLIRALGADLSLKAAECIYAAISTDTGSFRYESTSSHTFRIAAELLDIGVRPDLVSSNLYDNSSLGRLQLMQEVLATLEMHERDRIAIMHVTQKMLERTFTTMQDTDFFINLPRSVRSVRVAVLLKEIDNNSTSVSMRAKGLCDVAAIATRFGGGGHRNAAGFRARHRSVGDVRAELLDALREAVQN